jgi:hypothetical protein
VRYTLSLAAVVRMRVERVLPGRSVGNRCVAPRTALRSQARCSRYRTLPGVLTGPGAAGANRLAFHGRLAGHRLPAGRYRLRVTVAGAAPVWIVFRVLRAGAPG